MSMSKPPIMGHKMFVVKTTTRSGAVVRSSLSGIDASLKSWHARPNKDNHAHNIPLLHRILAESAGWLHQKAGKIAANSNNTMKRKRVVDELADQVMLRLKWEIFQKNKAGNYQALPNRPAARSLRPGHTNEKGYYDARKDRNPRGFSPNFGGGSMVDANMQAAGMMGGVPADAPPMVRQVFQQGTAFANLTSAQYEALAEYFLTNNMSMQQPVHYARKAERINQNMLIVVSGRLQKQRGTNYTSANGGDFDMWAMDRYGNFMTTAANAQLMVGNDPYQFNHSSLNAGNDVICAGKVRINDGIITHLDNESGHYQPTKQNLHDALICLVDELGAHFDANAVVQSVAPPREQFPNWQALYHNAGAVGVAF